jgi:hypothetical protein
MGAVGEEAAGAEEDAVEEGAETPCAIEGGKSKSTVARRIVRNRIVNIIIIGPAIWL